VCIKHMLTCVSVMWYVRRGQSRSFSFH